MSERAEWKVDRTNWAAGPWDGEPDKMNWTTKAGLPGMIVRNQSGALCGYVAVTKDHPWFEKHYGEGPETTLEVHGGITYSKKCVGPICHVPEPGEPDDVWWFGFDCNHGGDHAPGSHALLSPIFLRDIAGPFGGEYRDEAYVRGEVESLAEQLATVLPGEEGSK